MSPAPTRRRSSRLLKSQKSPPPQVGEREHRVSRHRHYKYTARAFQRADEDTVAFRLTTPAGGAGLPLAGAGYKATLLGISSRPALGRVHYHLELSLSFLHDRDSLVYSYWKNLFFDDMTWEKVAKKFKDFHDKVRADWAYFREVPHIRSKRTADGRGHIFELTLPPQTGFYVENKFFWSAFRFRLDHVGPSWSEKPGMGPRHGITNYSSRFQHAFSRPLLDSESPAFLYGMSADTAKTITDTTKIEVEFFPERLPLTLTEEKEMLPQTAAEAVARLVDAGMTSLGMSDVREALEVDAASTPGSILLRNDHFTEVKGARTLIFKLKLSETLASLFDVKETSFTFATNDHHVVALPLQTPTSRDVLATHYPLHLVAVGQPGAHHFVHGLGWVTLFGLLSETGKILGRPEWVELLPGQTELRLSLVDRWCNRVIPASVTEHVLYLEIVDLF